MIRYSTLIDHLQLVLTEIAQFLGIQIDIDANVRRASDNARNARQRQAVSHVHSPADSYPSRAALVESRLMRTTPSAEWHNFFVRKGTKLSPPRNAHEMSIAA